MVGVNKGIIGYQIRPRPCGNTRAARSRVFDAVNQSTRWFRGRRRSDAAATVSRLQVPGSTSFDLLWICRTACCTTCFTTNQQLIEIQQQVDNTSPRQVVRQAACLTTSLTTCRRASPQQIHRKLHATISKSYSKSHNLLYKKNPQLIEPM